ncbi:putative LRR receptor-like serine/threonine-protein kinase [Hordeum vulgare]|nr:putative LRR receptor-like serine/threonine-protein kinase [Hordeum vulgare]
MHASAAATPPRVVSTAVSGANVAPPPHVSVDTASPPRVVSTVHVTPPPSPPPPRLHHASSPPSPSVHANDDNDDYDIDEQSYAESGTHGGVDGPNGNDEHVGDLEFDLDIGCDEYQQETLDRHWEVMAKTFRSEGEGYMFYNQYTKDR